MTNGVGIHQHIAEVSWKWLVVNLDVSVMITWFLPIPTVAYTIVCHPTENLFLQYELLDSSFRTCPP
jgi:hypothetical protein